MHPVFPVTFAVVFATAFVGTVRAQVPTTIHYQGRIVADGVNFDGSGQFKFALIDAATSATYWSNNGTSSLGSEPSAAVSIPVERGLYAVVLGDTSLPNMITIPPSVFTTHAALKLRVWFNDGVHGSQLLSPDEKLSAAAYAIMAGTAANANLAETVANGAITPAKIADGAVTMAKIAPGAVGSDQLAADAVTTIHLADNAVTGVKIAPQSVHGDAWSPAQVVNLAPRLNHTAVWTGTDMIIWGGMANGFLTGDGARYQPVNNTWTAVAPAPLLSRAEHSAVWSGTEMIIWGGRDGIGLNSGASYHPGTNTWTALPVAGGPGSRFGHTAVWTGVQMLIWGGFDKSTGEPLNTGALWKQSSNTWSTMPLSGLAPRGYHTAVWTGTEMVIWGGQSGTNGRFNDGARYNPSTGTWQSVAASGVAARARHSAVWTGNRMIIWGGSGTGGPFADGARWEAATNTWTLTAPAPLAARSRHTAVWDGPEMIIWGGTGTQPFADGARYSPDTDNWAGTTWTALVPRSDHTAVWDGTRMIVWGGTGATPQADGARYYPVSNILNGGVASAQLASDPASLAQVSAGTVSVSGNTLNVSAKLDFGTAGGQSINLNTSSNGIGTLGSGPGARMVFRGDYGFGWYANDPMGPGPPPFNQAQPVMTLTSDGFGTLLDVNGSISGNIQFPSDRNLKENLTAVDCQDVLARITALPVLQWNYITDPEVVHIGPMAQDFRAAFQLGNDDRHIGVVDECGVALAAIKALSEKAERMEKENATLKERLAALERSVADRLREPGGKPHAKKR